MKKNKFYTYIEVKNNTGEVVARCDITGSDLGNTGDLWTRLEGKYNKCKLSWIVSEGTKEVFGVDDGSEWDLAT